MKIHRPGKDAHLRHRRRKPPVFFFAFRNFVIAISGLPNVQCPPRRGGVQKQLFSNFQFFQSEVKTNPQVEAGNYLHAENPNVLADAHRERRPSLPGPGRLPPFGTSNPTNFFLAFSIPPCLKYRSCAPLLAEGGSKATIRSGVAIKRLVRNPAFFFSATPALLPLLPFCHLPFCHAAFISFATFSVAHSHLPLTAPRLLTSGLSPIRAGWRAERLHHDQAGNAGCGPR